MIESIGSNEGRFIYSTIERNVTFEAARNLRDWTPLMLSFN